MQETVVRPGDVAGAVAQAGGRRLVFNPKLAGNRGGGREANALWYLSKTDEDLKLVTSASKNDDLGILEIIAYEPSEQLMQSRPDCVAQVRLRLGLAGAAGLELGLFSYKVVKSRYYTDARPAYRLQGAGFMQGGTPDPNNPNRKTGGQWYDYTRLPKAIKAQVLRYVSENLVDLEEAAQADMAEALDADQE